MLWDVALCVGIGLGLVVVWYAVCAQLNRRRSVRILGLIQSAFSGHGGVAGSEWISASHLLVRLRLHDCDFLHPRVHVKLTPREWPTQWLLARFRRKEETLTFEANLPYLPHSNLEVHNRAWRIRKRRTRVPRQVSDCRSLGPFVISSRYDWQHEITRMMNAFVASRECEFLSVSLCRTAPHFVATVSLKAFALHAAADSSIFEVLRELAENASAARF
jgi:hypothetical protein